MASFPGVQQAAAVVHQDCSTGSTRLVGYVSPASVQEDEVLRWCHASLLPAMVPTAIVVLQALPNGLGGKVDPSKLAPPSRELNPDRPEQVMCELRRRLYGVPFWKLCYCQNILAMHFCMLAESENSGMFDFNLISLEASPNSYTLGMPCNYLDFDSQPGKCFHVFMHSCINTFFKSLLIA